MQLGMIGLGRMGANMSHRLLDAGHQMVVFNRNPAAAEPLVALGAKAAKDLRQLVSLLQPPRAAWLMLPAGAPTETTVASLLELLAAGDILIEGGNSNYRDSQRRAASAAESGVHYLDVGVSGGIWGLKEGYGLMIGGDTQAVESLEPIFASLAPAADRGWAHVGPSGAGHFVKMVHNGIEYGVMQAYAEGFALLKAKESFGLDLHQVAEAWRHGTVIRSWLLDLTARALAEDANLTELQAWVDDSGEGRWTVSEAIDLAVPVPVIAQALISRFRSRRPENFADRMLAAMRQQFGGHAVKPKE